MQRYCGKIAAVPGIYHDSRRGQAGPGDEDEMRDNGRCLEFLCKLRLLRDPGGTEGMYGPVGRKDRCERRRVILAAVKKRETGAQAESRMAEALFNKEQIAASGRYRSQRDLVEALLTEGKTYTIAAVDNMIEKYRKGKVN